MNKKETTQAIVSVIEKMLDDLAKAIDVKPLDEKGKKRMIALAKAIDKAIIAKREEISALVGFTPQDGQVKVSLAQDATFAKKLAEFASLRTRELGDKTPQVVTSFNATHGTTFTAEMVAQDASGKMRLRAFLPRTSAAKGSGETRAKAVWRITSAGLVKSSEQDKKGQALQKLITDHGQDVLFTSAQISDAYGSAVNVWATFAGCVTRDGERVIAKPSQAFVAHATMIDNLPNGVTLP